MKAVLNTYKDRLVNISGRNRSLVLRKSYKKRSFDIVGAYQLQEGSIQEVIAYLKDEEKKSVTILQDPFKRRNELYDNLKLLNFAEEAMAKEEAKIERFYEKMLSLSSDLSYLLRETLAIEKESGKYELYVGYPFIEGKFKDGTLVRAPFFLFPVELEFKNNQWTIKNNQNQEAMVNKVFLFAANKCHQSQIKEYDDLDFALVDIDKIGDFVLQELSEMGITAKVNGSYAELTPYTNATLPNFTPGQLELHHYVVLGQFPISNSIYSDYEVLVDEPQMNRSLEQLLSTKQLSKSEDVASGEDQGTDANIFTITDMDYSQESAIKRIRSTKQLVIYGPPGTGKSQTIANMVSDALSNGQKVLVVSQKRAALDVLYNRLSGIQSKLMMIHDANKDKRIFFDKLKISFENGFASGQEQLKSDYQQNLLRIESLMAQLKLIEEELCKERPLGISLQEMYTKCDGIFSTEDSRFGVYKQFCLDHPFKKYRYMELEDAFERLNRQPKIVDIFFKYRKLVEKCSYLEYFSRNFSVFEKDAAHKAITAVKGTKRQLEGIEREVYLEIIGLLNPQKRLLTLIELEQLGKLANRRKNAHLLDEEKVNWWNVGKMIRRVTHAKERKKNEEAYLSEESRWVHYYEDSGKILNSLLEQAAPLFDLLEEEGKKKLMQELLDLQQADVALFAYLESLGNKEVHQELNVSMKALDPLDVELLNYSYRHSDTTEKMETLLDDLLEFIILEQIQEIEKTPEFAEFYQCLNRFEEITKETHRILNVNESLTQSIVNAHWNEKLHPYMDSADYKELRRQAEKKRQLWPIRKMLSEFQELILSMYPCWLMSPETVSDVLPLQKDSFDLLIFDEASQMFVENSIPTIYRAAKVVVAGDDKQLRPTSAFMTRVDDEEIEGFDLDTAAAREEESLLDLAKVNYHQVYLNYHYRSKFEELIQFSNHAFYGGRLNVAPNRTKLHYDKTTPIERIKVQGKWVNRKNNEEANRVVELVNHLLKNRSEGETIGIITFNINQKDLIEDLLEARCQIDSVFRKLYEEEMVRKKKDEDISIFVKNIENVQGDERDIIIFSVGYAPNEEGKISVNFGSLSQDGGENRLNVAISRAKKKCYVITSIEPEELIVAKTKNNGARLFKEYLQYAKEVSNSDMQRKNFVLSQLNPQIVSDVSKEHDEFAREIGNRLQKAGYQVEMNIGSGSYRLDLAIWDPKNNAYVLGIECDTSLYRNGQSTKERDIYRQQFYEARGWTVMRVWSYDWWKNPDRIIEKILQRLEEKYQGQIAATIRPEEKIQYHLVKSNEGIGQTEPICWYGDVVLLRDLISKEVFQVEIDGTEETKEQLNNFKQLLPGQKVGSRIAYRNYEYIIDAIMKKGTNTP